MPLCHKQSRRSRDAPILELATNLCVGRCKRTTSVVYAVPSLRYSNDLVQQKEEHRKRARHRKRKQRRDEESGTVLVPRLRPRNPDTLYKNFAHSIADPSHVSHLTLKMPVPPLLSQYAILAANRLRSFRQRFIVRMCPLPFPAESPYSATTSLSRCFPLRDRPVLPSSFSHGEMCFWSGIRFARRKSQNTNTMSSACIFNLPVTPNFEWWSAGRNGIEKTTPGSLILIPPGTRDRLRWRGASDRLIVSIRPDALNRKAEELDSSGEIEFVNRWSLLDAPLTNILKEMGREASAGWPLGALYANLLETSLTSHLLQRHAANPVRIPNIKGKLPMPRLRSAFEFIADNLHRDLSLDDIAKHIALSPFHFAREFRNTTGQTPYQYVLDQRIARAKQLLKLRIHSVQEVAYETGFQSPAHFIRAFHQRAGITPGAWRDS